LITHMFINQSSLNLTIVGSFAAFAVTCFALTFLVFLLPVDHGRAFAVEGVLSKGKKTGAGFLFISIFVLSVVIFVPLRLEYVIYYLLIETAMIAGYLDDGAKRPWSEYKKGLVDLLISFSASFTFAYFSNREIFFPIFGNTIVLPFAVYLILGTILVWGSINATNCTDGVDGLSSSLAIISLASMAVFSTLIGTAGEWTGTLFIMAAVLFSYLWFNSSPSKLLMGDAGSRAIGVFLAVSIMQTRQPFVYLVFCLVILVDGSAGILKISLKRFLHISILKGTTTPFHDHLRKNLGWSNPQVANRASILQITVSCIYLYIVFLFIQR